MNATVVSLPRLTRAQAPLTRAVLALDEHGNTCDLSIPAERALTVYVDKQELITLMTLGADRIMFSVDWPYEKNEWGQEYLKQLPISPEDLAKITHLNAERLLKL